MGRELGHDRIDQTLGRIGGRQRLELAENTPQRVEFGLRCGIVLLGAEWSVPALIKLAFAYEQLAKTRRPPLSTPPLRR